MIDTPMTRVSTPSTARGAQRLTNGYAAISNKADSFDTTESPD